VDYNNSLAVAGAGNGDPDRKLSGEFLPQWPTELVRFVSLGFVVSWVGIGFLGV